MSLDSPIPLGLEKGRIPSGLEKGLTSRANVLNVVTTRECLEVIVIVRTLT